MNGDDKPIEDRIRNNEESIRNLSRIGGETVSAIRSLHERLSQSQEYYLRDNRLTAEELKDAFKEYSCKQEKKYNTHDERLSALETWRNILSGAYGAACIFVAAWFQHHVKR